MEITFEDNIESDSIKLVGSGEIVVIMVMNLGRFMAEEDNESRKIFREIRGTEEYVNYLKNLIVPQLFPHLGKNIKGSDAWTEIQGIETGVFQKQLVENWFLPTYNLDKNAALTIIERKLSESAKFQKEWLRWDHYKVRLTRNGFIIVKLIRNFKQVNLYDLSIQLLEPERDEFRLKLTETFKTLPANQQKELKNILQQPLQWQLAYQVIRLFIQELHEMKFSNNRTVRLKMPKEEKKVPIRHQYAVLFFRKLFDQQDINKERLSGSNVFTNKKYARAISTIWDGTLIGNRDKKSINFPEYSEKELTRLSGINLSTWNNEICLIGFERAVIYCPMAEESIYLPFKGENAKEGIKYDDHWKCIIRGIEHIIGLRAELQMLEAYTNFEMSKIPTFTHQLTTKGISRKEKKEVQKLAQRVANLFNILTFIRAVLVAPSAYRASYAIKKFALLTKIFGLDQVEKHVEKSIDELNFFLSHYNKMEIQQSSDRLQRLAIFFGMGIGFLGLASLLKDAKELNDILAPSTFGESIKNLWYFITNLSTLSSLFFIWIVFAVLFFIGWKTYIYFND